MSQSNIKGDLNPDYNIRSNEKMQRSSSQHDSDLKKAKRKSNAYMAAEALEQERDAVTALKRLSIGRSSINVDPDLPYGVDGDFNYNDYSTNRHHRRKSSQSSDSSTNTTRSTIDEDKDKTLIEDHDSERTRISDSTDQDNDDDDVKLNAEKLLWVPAKSHPNIAPDQFRRHVQSTIDDMNNRLGEDAHITSTLTSRDSIPSLKELTDELDRLSEMAGLAATDAVTLARSLSSASGSSSFLLDKEENRFFQDSQNKSTSPSSNSPQPSRSSSLSEGSTDDEVDQDAPLLGEGSSTLRRNKWTTYSRSHRGGKDKPRPKAHSPLSDEHRFVSQQEPNLEKELPPNPPDEHQENEIPTRNVPLQDPQKQKLLSEQSRGRSYDLSRSQSDPSTALPQQKRTNHSRNRHAGSVISIDPTAQTQLQPQHKQLNQRRVVSSDSKPYPRQTSQNHTNLHEIQDSRPLPVHPQQKPVPSLPQQRPRRYKSHQERTEQKQQEIQHQLHNRHHLTQQQQRPQQYPTRHTNKELPLKKLGSGNNINDAPVKTPSPTTTSFKISPSSSPTTSNFSIQPEQQQQQQQSQISNDKPEKTKKDNSFLKMFKKKRSPSPKNQKTLPSIGSKTSPTVNDENRSPTGTQFNIPVSPEKKKQIPPQQQSQPPSQQQIPNPHSQQKRPILKPSKSSQFKFSKSSKHEDKLKSSNLQESVTIVSKKDDNKYRESENQQSPTTQQQISPESEDASPPQQEQQSLDPKNQQQFHQQTGQALNEEQHRFQKETLSKKLSLENMKKPSKPNAPVQFTDSAFGFPLPPLSHSTVVMLDYRFPIHVERALYRLSHLKLANPRRPLRQQVLLSNFMYSYLNLVNHTLYLQQLDENHQELEEDHEQQKGQINIEL